MNKRYIYLFMLTLNSDVSSADEIETKDSLPTEIVAIEDKLDSSEISPAITSTITTIAPIEDNQSISRSNNSSLDNTSDLGNTNQTITNPTDIAQPSAVTSQNITIQSTPPISPNELNFILGGLLGGAILIILRITFDILVWGEKPIKVRTQRELLSIIGRDKPELANSINLLNRELLELYENQSSEAKKFTEKTKVASDEASKIYQNLKNLPDSDEKKIVYYAILNDYLKQSLDLSQGIPSLNNAFKNFERDLSIPTEYKQYTLDKKDASKIYVLDLEAIKNNEDILKSMTINKPLNKRKGINSKVRAVVKEQKKKKAQIAENNVKQSWYKKMFSKPMKTQN